MYLVKSLSSQSVLSAGQFNSSELKAIIDLSAKLEVEFKSKKRLNLLNDFILACLFFEPSTRTRLSFEAAMHMLGGRVISTVGVQFSSLAKGESLFDTLKMIEAYSDICVIRHPVEGASVLAAKNISVPVINGGDGAGEHPTQALLDLYTIEKHKKIYSQKLKIAFIGDIKYGRTIHSLIYLLQYFDIEIFFISPNDLRLPEKYREFLKKCNVSFYEVDTIETIAEVDVAYVTRIQEERFTDHAEYLKFKDSYIINKTLLDRTGSKAIIMHPLPRLAEVSTDIDDLRQAVYFDQAKNGLYVRMALLLLLLNKGNEVS